MEVIIPSPLDFNFDSTCTSPYVSAPSSPQRFGNLFFSAPTSPTRAASFYREFNDFSLAAAKGGDSTTSAGGSLFTIPFDWEEKPGTPKVKASMDFNDDTDFEFDFSGQLDRISLSADELFDGGKIKPLKPPPRLDHGFNDSPRSPRSPRSPIGSKILSPRQRKRDFDPFAAAIEQTRKQSYDPEQRNEQQRGRERKYNSSHSSSRHKATRSWSPFRVSDILMEREINQQQQSNNSSNSTTNKQSSSSQFSSSTSSWIGYRKWRLKDFLLFRSASEGRPASKETLKKYSALKKSVEVREDLKNSSFRSTDSGGSVSSSRRRGPVVSAHELHYKVNRSVTEEMKKRTFLPYNRGLLGCLGFNPAVHGFSGRLGSLPRG